MDVRHEGALGDVDEDARDALQVARNVVNIGNKVVEDVLHHINVGALELELFGLRKRVRQERGKRHLKEKEYGGGVVVDGLEGLFEVLLRPMSATPREILREQARDARAGATHHRHALGLA